MITKHKIAARIALSLAAEAVKAEDWDLAQKNALILAHESKLIALSEDEEREDAA